MSVPAHELAVEWIDREPVRVYAVLFNLADIAYLFRLALLGNQLLHGRAQGLVVTREVGD